MKALWFVAIQNLKKKKGDVVVLFFVIALATVLLYTSLSVFLGMDKVIDNAYERAHTADLLFMSNVEEDRIREILSSQEEVEEYEATDSIYLLETQYRKEGDEENNQSQFCIGSIEEKRNIGKLTGIENIDVQYDSVVLPYYMKVASGYSVGDACYFTFGDKEYEFKVAGFVEDPLFGTPLNISTYSIYISEKCMEDLLAENDTIKSAKYIQHKVRLKQGENSYDFDTKVSPILTKEIPELSETINLGINWEGMKGGLSMMPRISMGILLVFSLLLILVVLIIMRFSIRNHIEMNLKNVGILQAAGYTSSQLNITVLIEMGIIAGVGVVAGILLGIAGSGLIGTFQGVMMGLEWRQNFHMVAAVITLVTVLGIVMLVSFISGRIYKKLSVLESLRGGIHTHNYKKNYFGFDKSRLPIAMNLAGKNMMFEKAKNISIFCMIVLLAFSACVGFGMYENFALRSDNLLKMVGSEAGDVFVSGENMEEVGKELEQWPQVEEVLCYGQESIRLESKDGDAVVTCDTWDKPESLQNEMIVRGRLPKYDNEIVLTTGIAKKLNVETGDTIYVTGQRERKDYIVCGIDQKINNMGLKALLNREGAIRLNGSSPVMMLYIYTKGNVDYEHISKEIIHHFPDVAVTDSEKAVKNVSGSVTMAMIAICVIFVMITIFVVAMVEVLLVKSKVIRERKNLGLNKAFGFTTGQLMVQTIMVNLPVITIGAVCGVIISCFFMEQLIVSCLSFCGIEKCPFTINVQWMAITVIGIVVVAIVASGVSAMKIRKIEPVKMLTEE